MLRSSRSWFLMRQIGAPPCGHQFFMFIIEEPPSLLDLGFQKVLTRILTHLPKQRRTGLFSATMTDADALSELVRAGLRNPAKVVVKVQSKKKRTGLKFVEEHRETVEERRIPARSPCLMPDRMFADSQLNHSLQNFYLVCKASEKLLQLSRLISDECERHSASRFIVYFATCACVNYFYRVRPRCHPSTSPLCLILSCTRADTSCINLSPCKALLPSRPSAIIGPHESPGVIFISPCHVFYTSCITDYRRCRSWARHS